MSKSLLVSVVEDDGSFRDSMSILLTSFGYSVEAFPSAADFLASPRVSETACLIADVNMPEMTGVELYERLRWREAYGAFPRRVACEVRPERRIKSVAPCQMPA
jgi:FixJ family two-component response regulator